MAKNGFKPKVSWPYPNILTISPLQTKQNKKIPQASKMANSEM